MRSPALPFRIMIILAFTCMSNTFVANAQPTKVPFDTTFWDLSQARITEFAGKKCITGSAMLKSTELRNGVVEFMMAVTGERAYPGVIFRSVSSDDYERIYIRPHLPSQFQNVIQYVASFHGIDSWQLYSGEGYTAAAEIPKNEWFHVRLEFFENQARLFLNHSTQPVLTVHHLAHETCSGRIGLQNSNPNTAYFADFSINPDQPFDLLPEAAPETPSGVLCEWQLSSPYKAAVVDNETTPEEQAIRDIQWQNIQCRPDGIVDISRLFGRKSNAPEVVFARTIIESGKDELRMFSFGYSDFISVFLNGKLIFSGNSAYTSRDPSFQGIVGLNDYLNLPLKKGKNELLLTLTESSGGWGFIFRDTKATWCDTRLKPQWEIKNKLFYPESVTYDSKRDLLYVSNYFNDGNEFISSIKPDGEITKLEWVGGVRQPTGLCMSNDKLYVTGRMALVEIDPDQGRIINRYPFPEPGMANDVTADASGNLYISDTRKNLIYRLSEGKMEVWLKSQHLSKPNGLLVDGDRLLVGNSGDGCVKIVDLKTKQVSTLVCLGQGSIIDGLAADGNGGYLISDYNGRLFHADRSGNKRLLLNTTASSRPCADFGYIPEKRLLVIPGLIDNRVSCYEYNP